MKFVKIFLACVSIVCHVIDRQNGIRAQLFCAILVPLCESNKKKEWVSILTILGAIFCIVIEATGVMLFAYIDGVFFNMLFFLVILSLTSISIVNFSIKRSVSSFFCLSVNFFILKTFILNSLSKTYIGFFHVVSS
jgi:hypothetical protein